MLTFWGIFATLIFLFFSFLFFFKMIHWKGDRNAMPQVKNISITIHWILSDFFGFTFQAGCITLCDQPEKDFKTRNYSTDAIWSLLTLFFSNTSKIGHSGKKFNPAQHSFTYFRSRSQPKRWMFRDVIEHTDWHMSHINHRKLRMSITCVELS